MGELVKIIINWLWANFLEPIFKRLDRWDILFLAILGLAAYLALQRTEFFTTEEQVLLGTLLLVVGLGWFMLRRIPWKAGKSALRASVPKFSILLLLSGIWGYAFYRSNQVSPFRDGVMGIYIARFDNDPSDKRQQIISDFLEDVISRNRIENVQVRKLYRRFQASDQAQKIGAAGNAILVLWGKLAPPPKISLSIIPHAGIYSSAASVGGRSEFSTETDKFDLPSDLDDLQAMLAFFFQGYSYYHSGENNPDNYDYALRSFLIAKQNLEELVKNQTGDTPERASLGSIDFYLGNTYVLKNNPDLEEAKKEYKLAIERTLHPIKQIPLFVEPVNNLARLLLRERKPDEAIRYLKQADTSCIDENRRVPCTYVSYNLGRAYIDKKQYQESLKHFNESIGRFNSISQSLPPQDLDFRLLADAHQQVAFCYCKIADRPGVEGREENYHAAQQQLNRAIAILQNMQGEKIPAFYNITRGRIEIGLTHYKYAIDVLEDARKKLEDEQVGTKDEYPQLYLLLGTAYQCTGEAARATDYLARFIASPENEPGENVRYLREYTGSIAKQCRPVSNHEGGDSK